MMLWGEYGWGMGFGWIWMIIFWALVIVGVVYLVKFIARSAQREERHDAPLDILKKRYAKGEISKEEFEKMRDDLMKS
jgi:putative membrane protein